MGLDKGIKAKGIRTKGLRTRGSRQRGFRWKPIPSIGQQDNSCDPVIYRQLGFGRSYEKVESMDRISGFWERG